MAAQNQAKNGAQTYKELCSYSQTIDFHETISSISIQPGWKVLDFGCGTGNHTVLLAEMVGPKGMVIGIDPDKERIGQAKATYHRENLKFQLGSEKNILEYGTDFDLIISSEVVHWLTAEQKSILFQNASKCLKENGWLCLSLLSDKEESMWELFHRCGSLGKEIIQLFHRENEQYFEDQAKENGFVNFLLSARSTTITFESLSDALKWYAASCYSSKYDETFKTFQDVCKKEDVSFLFNKDGVVYDEYELFYILCQKI